MWWWFFHVSFGIADSLVATNQKFSKVKVPQWQSDLMVLLAKPFTSWSDLDHNLFQYLLGKVGYQLAGEVEPAEDDVVDAPPPKAPRDWRQLKERCNAGSYSTDYFRDDASKEKPYRMNGWLNRMIPLVGAHLRGDVELASRLAFKYAEHKSIEKQVEIHNHVMILRGFDPKYGVGDG